MENPLSSIPTDREVASTVDAYYEEIRTLTRRLLALERRVSALESENHWLKRQNEVFFDQMGRWRSQVDSVIKKLEVIPHLGEAA